MISLRKRALQKRIIVTLLIVLLLSQALPPVRAQSVNSWTIDVDNRVVWIEAELSGIVTGPQSSFFQLVLVNRTTGVSYDLHLGFTGNYSNVTFSEIIRDGWIPPGSYSLNLTVDRRTMAFTYVNIVYNEEYIEDLEREKNRSLLEDLIRWVTDLNEVILEILDNQDITYYMIILIFSIMIYILQSHIYYVLIPRVVEFWRTQGRKKESKNKLIPRIRAGIVQWHDKFLPPTPELSKANIDKIEKNLQVLGVTDYEAEGIVLDITGDPALAKSFGDRIATINNKQTSRVNSFWFKVLMIMGLFGILYVLLGKVYWGLLVLISAVLWPLMFYLRNRERDTQFDFEKDLENVTKGHRALANKRNVKERRGKD